MNCIVGASQNETDEIILNSGKTISGKIIAQKPGEFIRLVRYNITDTVTIDLSDINLIRKTPYNLTIIDPIITLDNNVGKSYIDSVRLQKLQKTYVSFYTLAALGNTNTEGVFGQGLGLSFSKVFSQKFQLGTSIGAYFNNIFTDMMGFLPLTLDGRFRIEEIMAKKAEYYIKSSIGHASVLIEDSFFYKKNSTKNNLIDGGIQLKLGIGFEKTNVRNKRNSIEFGILLQQFKHQDYQEKLPKITSSKGRMYVQTSFSF